MTQFSSEIVLRLREEARTRQHVAWGRMDGGQDWCLSAAVADEAADLIEELVEALRCARFYVNDDLGAVIDTLFAKYGASHEQ